MNETEMLDLLDAARERQGLTVEALALEAELETPVVRKTLTRAQGLTFTNLVKLAEPHIFCTFYNKCVSVRNIDTSFYYSRAN